MLVLCCGMIRSGSTLQYNLTRSLVEAADRGRTHGWLASRPGPDYATRADLEKLAAGDEMLVAKSHNLLGIDENPLPDGGFALCYCYRDIRDVAGSAKTFWESEGDALMRRIEEALQAFDRVQGMPNCLMQSYELLTGDTDAAAAQIAEHLKLGLSEDAIGEVAAAWSSDRVAQRSSSGSTSAMKRVKRMIDASGLRGPARVVFRMLPTQARKRLNPLHGDDSLLHERHVSSFTRDGLQSRAALTDDELRRVMEIGGAWLEAMGYETAEPERAADGAHGAPA